MSAEAYEIVVVSIVSSCLENMTLFIAALSTVLAIAYRVKWRGGGGSLDCIVSDYRGLCRDSEKVNCSYEDDNETDASILSDSQSQEYRRG